MERCFPITRFWTERLFDFSITHAHTSQLGVCGWGFLRLSDRQKEEREEIENIG